MYLFVKCCMYVCPFVQLRLSPGRVGPGIKIYRVIVASTVPVAPPGGEKNPVTPVFLRFFVRSVPLFRSLMLTPMSTRRKPASCCSLPCLHPDRCTSMLVPPCSSRYSCLYICIVDLLRSCSSLIFLLC